MIILLLLVISQILFLVFLEIMVQQIEFTILFLTNFKIFIFLILINIELKYYIKVVLYLVKPLILVEIHGKLEIFMGLLIIQIMYMTNFGHTIILLQLMLECNIQVKQDLIQGETCISINLD